VSPFYLFYFRREKFCGKPRKSAFGGNGVNSCGGNDGNSFSPPPPATLCVAMRAGFNPFSLPSLPACPSVASAKAEALICQQFLVK